jgi:type II secretory pathway pseudopilin PulG
MTLIELLVAVGVLGIVLLAVMGISLSTSRLHGKLSRRAEVQMGARQGLSLLATELRQAGADPADPPIGVVGIVAAQSDLIHIRADLNGDGVIQTSEPSEDVTYRFDPVARAVLRDPGSGPQVVVPNVSAMALTYFDASNLPIGPLPLSATNAARVRTVGVSITSTERDSLAITLTTQIALRNMEG